MAAPVIWFGSWLVLLMVFVLIALLPAAFCSRSCLGLGNKKGPEEAHAHRPKLRMTSAIPGGAPGYDDDKDFGNNIAHWPGRLPEGCANHNGQTLNVKAEWLVCAISEA